MRPDLHPWAIFGCNIAKWTILCIVVHFQPVIKLLQKGVRVHQKRVILMQKNAKFFWGGGRSPLPRPIPQSGEGHPVQFTFSNSHVQRKRTNQAVSSFYTWQITSFLYSRLEDSNTLDLERIFLAQQRRVFYFLSASLYFSKRSRRLLRYMLCPDVVGCHASALWPNGAS